MNREQQIISDYLNPRDVRPLFLQKMADNKEAIFSAVRRLTDDDVASDQKRILENMYSNKFPQIVYAPTKRSPRLYTLGDNPVGLKRIVRKALCKGWHEIDLQSAQFHILARVLDAPLSLAISQSGASIWDVFNRFINGIYADMDPRDKAEFKVFIYSLAFGAKDPGSKLSDKNFPITELPLVKELLVLRNQRLEQIEKDGGHKDVWGNFWPVSYELDYKRKASIPRSVFSSCIQSYEVFVISRIFELAETIGEYHIRLHLHDGILVEFLANKEQHIRDMRNAVKEKAAQVGVAVDITEKLL